MLMKEKNVSTFKEKEKKMNLARLVRSYIEVQKIGSPIFISDILYHVTVSNYCSEDTDQIRKNINVILMRMVKNNGGLKRYSQGVYYRVEKGIDSDINKKELIEKSYIRDKQGNVFGYITGELFAKQIGTTIFEPDNFLIASNEKRNQKTCISEHSYKLVNPPVQVTNENFRYLQLLDLLKMDGSISSSATRCKPLLIFIKKYDLKVERLIVYASKYYNQKVVLRTSEVISAKANYEENHISGNSVSFSKKLPLVPEQP